MSVLVRRIARVARKRSAAAAVGAVARELQLLRDEAAVERALRSDRTVIVGPFVGEVGYELLYWRPRVLRLLRTRKVDPERVVVVTRGGAGAWYAPFAQRTVDVLDVVPPEELRRHVDELHARTGQRKQLAQSAFDSAVLDRVRESVGAADVLHPRLMYSRVRFLWDGLRAPEDALRLGDYDDLPRLPLPAPVEARLPARFVAAKLYFNEALAESASPAPYLDGDLPVVLLEAGVAVDDHLDWAGARTAVRVADLLEPATNLAVQAEIVARADRLVATYGGFSYVGPFTGTPTIALSSRDEPNPHHERVLRAARPDAAYERVRL